MTQNKKENEILFLAAQFIGCALFIVMLCFGVQYFAQAIYERRQQLNAIAEQKRLAEIKLNDQIMQAQKEVDEILAARSDPENYSKKRIDPWGTQYDARIEHGEEKVILGYVVMCAGPDKKFATEDDLIKNNNDLNWTNAGAAVGKRAGRASWGFIKGLWNSGDQK